LERALGLPVTEVRAVAAVREAVEGQGRMWGAVREWGALEAACRGPAAAGGGRVRGGVPPNLPSRGAKKTTRTWSPTRIEIR